MKKTMLVLVVCIISTQLMAQNTKNEVVPIPPVPPSAIVSNEVPTPPPPTDEILFTPPKIVKHKPATPPKPSHPPKAQKPAKEEVKFTPPVIVKDKE